MKPFYKVTRKDDDSVEAVIDRDCIIIKSDSKEEHEYIVLHRLDLEGIIWNYQDIIKNKGGK
jgi:hypothetical protein